MFSAGALYIGDNAAVEIDESYMAENFIDLEMQGSQSGKGAAIEASAST